MICFLRSLPSRLFDIFLVLVKVNSPIDDFQPEGCPLQFRPMHKADLPAIMEIERAVYNFPWTEGTFGDCIRVGYSCWVAEEQGRIVSYGIISVAAGESHVMNICVAPGVQRRGYGRFMMQKLIAVAAAGRAEVMFLEVRPSNQTAINLYHRMGFNEIGIRKNYYQSEDGREDALMLALAIHPGLE